MLFLCLPVFPSWPYILEIRSRRFGPARKQDRIFRCERCGSVYTDDADVDRSRCSQCGTLNEPFQF